MNRSDLMALAPWLAFGAVLGIVWLRLFRARHPARRLPAPPKGCHPHGRAGAGDSPGVVPRSPEEAAGSAQHGAGPQ